MSQILDKVSKAVRARALDPSSNASEHFNEVIDSEIELVQQGFSLEAELDLRQHVENKLFGYAQLQPLLDDPSIEEIWINGPSSVFIARSGVASRLDLRLQPEDIPGLVERMLRPTGRRLDRSSPFVDASLSDGTRLHVVIPDITNQHWAVNLRKFPNRIMSMEDLVIKGVLSAGQAEFLVDQVGTGSNVLISGATQAGKTTMLCALIHSLDPGERIVTVEETFEIRATNPDWVAMQTRQANLEGAGEVTLRRLIKEALRMRPSRLIVGEVREAEALDLLIALNSGLPGLCTIHANSADDALLKISTLPLLAGSNISMDFIRPTVASCLQYVVHCSLAQNGVRTVSEIGRVLQVGGELRSEPVRC